MALLPSQFTIEVLPEDIAKGKRGQHTACAIAKALRRQYPNRPWSVGATSASYFTGRRERVFRAEDPVEQEDFVLAFDAGDTVEPMSFTFIEDLDY